MTKYEKIVLLIIFLSILIANALFVIWTLRDLSPIYLDLFLALFVGPIIGILTGYVTGKIVTSHYRKRDRAERVSNALYGLQIYLKKLSTRLNDISFDDNNLYIHTSSEPLERIKDLLIDEPYSVFLDLSNKFIDEPIQKTRIEAFRIIAEVEDFFIYEKSYPTIKQVIEWKSSILRTRINLLRKDLHVYKKH